MNIFLPTLILRHRKENLKKCSLRGLEIREDYKFYSYPLNQELPSLNHYVVLTLGAQELSPKDSEYGLFLIDGTWKLAEKMEQAIQNVCIHKRSLPKGFVTAYPRQQTGCTDPESGLASVEALYIAHYLMGNKDLTLLDNYYWKDSFLQKNESLLHSLVQVW
ncbi:MAG: DUF367 domain-containing protein [Parachlamydiales bacterium]|nr:DUF367 domain-containing protein [Parachlamydiales bacterium]